MNMPNIVFILSMNIDDSSQGFFETLCYSHYLFIYKISYGRSGVIRFHQGCKS